MTLARVLTIAEFALAVIATTVVSLGSAVLALGLERVGLVAIVVRDGQMRRRAIALIIRLNLIAAGVGGLLIYLVWSVASFSRSTAGVTLSPWLVAAATAAETWRLVASELVRVGASDSMSMATGIGTRTSLALAAVGVLLLAGQEVTLSHAFAVLTFMSVMLAVIATAQTLRPRGSFSSEPTEPPAMVGFVRGLVRQGVLVVAAGLGRLALTQGDVLVVGAFFRPRDVAVYGVATRVANGIGVLSTSANVSALSAMSGIPLSANNTEESWAERARAARSSVVPTFVLGAAAAAVLALLGPAIVEAVFGAEFGGTGHILRVLLFGQVVNLATGVPGAVLLLAGVPHVTAVATSAAAVVALTAAYVMGAAGTPLLWVAVASAAGLAAENLGAWAFVKSRLGVNAGVGRHCSYGPLAGRKAGIRHGWPDD